jgi:hypothetical protein
LANGLFKKFLNGNSSELEANVPGSKCRQVSEILNQNPIYLENDLFDSILLSVKENLADTYSRFMITKEFENFNSLNNLVTESTGLFHDE